MTTDSGPAFYLDADVPAGLVTLLQRAGYEAHYAGTEGRHDDDDPSQMAFASEQGWVLITHNLRDFSPLHGLWISLYRWGHEPNLHPGILSCSPGRVGPRLRQNSRLGRSSNFSRMMTTLRTGMQVYVHDRDAWTDADITLRPGG